MSLLDQISEAFDSPSIVNDLANGLGADERQARELLGAGIPAVLAGLAAQVVGGNNDEAPSDGANALHAVVNTDGGGVFDAIGSLFGGGGSTRASDLIDNIFGRNRSAVEQGVAERAGGDVSIASRLLPLLAPAVMSLLGRLGSDLDAQGLAGQLGEVEPSGAVADLSDDDRDGFVAGLASLGDAGGLAALLPALGAVTSNKALVPTGSAAVAATSTATAGGLGASAGPPMWNDRERTGLGWLIPTLVLGGLLIFGLVAWQCSNSEVYQASVEVLDDPDPEPTTAPEPTAEPTAAPEPTPVPTPEPTAEPTATPAPTPTPEPVTIASLVATEPDLTSLLALAARTDLAALLSDPTAGPFTVFAPTNAAFEDAAAIVGRLDDDQLATTAGFHVVEGLISSDQLVPGAEFTTVSGEVIRIGDDGLLPGGASISRGDVETDNGIFHIVEGVLVPGSVQRSLATADVNELFALEPIQFASGSAEILPESIPTLDNAIAVLVDVPAGTLLEVQGHTDTDGDDQLNQNLSVARAESVVAYLTTGGVDPDILVPIGYGETNLKVDPELSPEDKAQNRRIEFVDITG